MRAFLSHSSKDKGFVERVADLLKPGTFEIDSATFDAGLVNSTVITEALERTDLFCLFLSADSAASPYVDFETLLGIEFFARGQISRFLAICIDESAFRLASENVKYFSIVRRVATVENAARLIQGALVSAAASQSELSHPFVGREEVLKQLEGQVTDPQRPPPKALYISGHFGAGRRTLVRRFFQNQYPQVGRIFPTIQVEEIDGLDETYRKALAALRPAMTARELSTRMAAFNTSGADGKAQLIADLLNSLLPGRESSFLVDVGGILDDNGAMHPEFAAIIDRLASKPHPPVSVISRRMIPHAERRKTNDIVYCDLRSLSREEALRLARRLLRDHDITAADDQITAIVELSDRHPYNFYRLLDEVDSLGLSAFLANPREFVEWKHGRSSEYLGRVKLDSTELTVLGLLKLLPVLDFAAIVDALDIDPNLISDALLRLTHLHVVEHSGDEYSISPPLRIAVERDRRAAIPEERRRQALAILAESLAIRLDEGTAAVALVDAAVLSAIEVGKETYAAAAFLLPSHYVWLEKRHYDRKDYPETIRLAKEALKSRGRLSRSGFVAACRFMCLAAARMADTATFDVGVGQLAAIAADDWSRSNVSFLRGFHERMKGHYPSAEEHFREAYRLSPGNYSTARELAAICLARGNITESEQYARKALEDSRDNPYVLDILLRVLTRKFLGRARENPEVRDLLDSLQRVGDEGGRSFYTTRRAEIEFYGGDRRMARQLAEEAIRRTPNVFEPRRIYAEILLAEGSFTRVADVLSWMKDKVNAPEPGERRTNYRAYLETKAHYLTEIGQYPAAKEIFDDESVFAASERDAAVREIELVQMAKMR